LCRALSESEPKAKFELSANHSGTLNECKPEAQHEFSEREKLEHLVRGRSRTLSESEPEEENKNDRK